MKEAFRIISASLAVLAALISCGNQSTETLWTTQETRIETFCKNQMAENDSAYIVTNNGSVRLVLVPGEGDELASDGTVSFYYAGYVLSSTNVSSSTLFATNYDVVAESAGWSLADSTVFTIETINLGETSLVTGLKNGLVGVQGGEECYILFSGKYGFGDKYLGTIPANSALAYHIWVQSITND